MGNSLGRRRAESKPGKKSGGHDRSGKESETVGKSFEEAEAATSAGLKLDRRASAQPLGLIAVKMQYSHKLGSISESYLDTLLNNLSKGNSSYSNYQWTLSAPIQSTSTQSAPQYSENGELLATLDTGAMSSLDSMNHYYTSTLPIANTSLTEWPNGVTKQTDTVVLELWISVPDLTAECVSEIECYVRCTVGTWLANTLGVTEHVWIMTRFMMPDGNGGCIESVKGLGCEEIKQCHI